MPETTMPTRFIGCDVGKRTITVFDSADGRTRTVQNNPEALAALATTLDQHCFVICEATGGYEACLLAAMVQAKVLAHRADARKVKAFIRSFGILGKTDAIDARALACYGQERHARLARWQAPDAERERLQALVLTRRDLVAQRTAFRNRLAAPRSDIVKDYLETFLKNLDALIAQIETDIATIVQASTRLTKAVETLRTQKGLGKLIAPSLIALMPELGTISGKQAAALASLAPHPVQSGNSDAYRRTKGGRPELKQILCLAAFTAIKHDTVLKQVYERLIANGKKPIVAITAIMRKIIVIANARLRDLFADPAYN